MPLALDKPKKKDTNEIPGTAGLTMCCSCWSLSPVGSIYCAGCGRSLGHRVCKQGHASPVTASRCVRCATTALSDPAWCLSLGWVSRTMAVLIVVGLLFLLHAVHCSLWAGLSIVLSWLLVHTIGMTITQLFGAAINLLLLVAVVAFLLHMAPDRIGKPLRSFLSTVLGLVWRAVWWAVRIICAGIGQMIARRAHKS